MIIIVTTITTFDADFLKEQVPSLTFQLVAFSCKMIDIYRAGLSLPEIWHQIDPVYP